MNLRQEERQKELTKERTENFLKSVQSKYILNFIDTADELNRYRQLKMYFDTKKLVQDTSHGSSYIELRKSYLEMGSVFWVGEEDIKIRELEEMLK